MKYKINHIMFLVLLVGVFASTTIGAADNKNQDKLRVYLPRHAAVDNELITLGQVGIIRGPAALTAKASDIALGNFTTAGQQITLSRTMIAARLSCSSIDASTVEISGAEKVIISSNQQIINGKEFVKAANAFLAKHYQTEPANQFNLLKTPDDLFVSSNAGKVSFSASLLEQSSNDCAKVRIAALTNGKEIGARCVDFRIRRAAPADKTIKTVATQKTKPEILVRRNKHVAVVIKIPGLAITAIGRALENGCAGEYIKVQMRITSTSRTIIAKVNNDGTVEPVM